MPTLLRMRPARHEDVAPICADLREWDLIECAMHGVVPSETMHAALSGPYWRRCRVLEDPDGKPMCIGGRSMWRPGEDFIWMLGTTGIERHRLRFLASSRAFLDECVDGVDRVSNIIPAGRHESIEWLRWLGFDFGPAFVHGSGIPVLPFWRDREPGPATASGPRLRGYPPGF